MRYGMSGMYAWFDVLLVVLENYKKPLLMLEHVNGIPRQQVGSGFSAGNGASSHNWGAMKLRSFLLQRGDIVMYLLIYTVVVCVWR